MMFLLMLIIIFLFFHNLILKYKEHKLNTFMVIHNKKD